VGSALTDVYAALDAPRARLAARDSAIIGAQIAVSEIPAPSGQEHQRAAWIAERFRTLGLSDVRTDAAGNVIARRPGAADEPSVAVCAHLDTVFPLSTDLQVHRDGDRLVGPGIGDNGRGLVAMLAIAQEIDGVTLRTRAPVDFVATTGEEGLGDLRGAKEFFAAAAEPIARAIAIDGPGDERVVHRALGSRRYRVTFRAHGGHSWAAYGQPNPVHAAAAAVAKLTTIPLPHDPRTTLTVARIGGGMAINAIPQDGWFEVDVRSTSASTLEWIDREMRRVLQAAEKAENDGRITGATPLICTMALIGDRPCGDVSVDHPLVTAAIEATRLIGREPDLAAASTDANVPISLGVPAIAVGAGGRGGDAHTVGEWYENTDGPRGLARALAIVVAAAGLAE